MKFKLLLFNFNFYVHIVFFNSIAQYSRPFPEFQFIFPISKHLTDFMKFCSEKLRLCISESCIYLFVYISETSKAKLLTLPFDTEENQSQIIGSEYILVVFIRFLSSTEINLKIQPANIMVT